MLGAGVGLTSKLRPMLPRIACTESDHRDPQGPGRQTINLQPPRHCFNMPKVNLLIRKYIVWTDEANGKRGKLCVSAASSCRTLNRPS